MFDDNNIMSMMKQNQFEKFSESFDNEIQNGNLMSMMKQNQFGKFDNE